MSNGLHPDLQAITWQLAAAFGQGAGTMIVATSAAQAVMDAYHEKLARMESWDAIALRMIEFMRALGAASAMHSLRRGGAVIETEDVERAMTLLKPRHAHPLDDCPVCILR